MAIVGNNIIKEFGNPPQRIIHGVNLKINDGEFVSISGRSGSGKSTLLYILSSLDKPTMGEVLIDGVNLATSNQKDLHYFRNTNIGFIFQFHYLLEELTALENVMLGPKNLKLEKEKLDEAYYYLKEFDIEHHAHKLPSQMSGGQQQRVAIARALIMKPKYIFADEPTGNLDSVNGQRVMEILKQANKERGTTVVLVTHEPDYSAMADREIFLVDGRIERS